MSNRGFIPLDRGFLDHPRFKPRGGYTVRDAWIYMLVEAVLKPTDIPVGNGTVRLERGELSHSLRFLAKKFGWSINRVRRFLDGLKADGSITTKIAFEADTATDTETDTQTNTAADTGQTVITICNYGKYNRLPKTADTATDTETDTATDTRTDTKKEQVTSNKEGGGPSGQHPPPIVVGATPLKKRRSATSQFPTDGEREVLKVGFNAYAASKGQSPGWAASEFEAFEDHAKANARAQADWSAAGKMWIRNGIKFAQRDRQSAGRGRSASPQL